MRKILLLMLFLTAFVPLRAIDIVVDGILYRINADNTTVTVVNPLDINLTTVVIPETVTYQFPPAQASGRSQGYVGVEDGDLFPIPGTTYTFTVTAILDRAFQNCTNLKSVELANTITSMGYESFKDCPLLENINIPTGITELSQILCNCPSLKTVTIPANVKKVFGCFHDCALDSLIIEDSAEPIDFCNTSTPFGQSTVTNIYQGRDITLQFDCLGLKTLTLGDMVTEICASQYVFGTLEEVNLGNGIKRLEQSAFYKSKIKTITLPESLEEIGPYSFDYCEQLESVRIPSKVTSLKYAFNSCKSLKDVYIPAGLVDIDQSFQYCGVIESLTFEDSDVELVGSGFWQCEGVRNIYQGRNIHCYFQNKGVEKLTISDNVTELFDVMYGYNPMNVLSIGNNVRKIGRGCFSHCDSLETVVLPESLEEMGSGVFYGCESLKNINIPSKLKVLNGEFRFCPSLKEIKIPGNIEKIDNMSFSDAQLKRLIFEDCKNPIEVDANSFGFADRNLQFIYIGRNWGLGCSTPRCYADSLIFGNEVTYITSSFEISAHLLELGTGIDSITGSFNQSTYEQIKVHRAEPPTFNSDNYYNFFREEVFDNALLFVPRQSRSKYAAAPVWKEFKHIIQDSCAVNFVYDAAQVGLTLPDGFNGLIAYGEELTFSAAALESYRLGNITFEGEYEAAEQGVDGSWTLRGLHSDVTVTIPSEEIYFAVKAAISSTAGRLTLNGAETDSIGVRYGTPLTVAMSLNEGFRVDSVAVNSVGLTVPVENDSFTIESVLEDLDIEILTALKSYRFAMQYDAEHGSVAIDGNTATEQEYAYGSQPVIEVLPDEGYALASAVLNGADITALFKDNAYRVDSIRSDMTLTVEFEARTIGLTILGLEGGRITTLNPYGSQSRLLITADDGWEVNTVTFNGNIVDVSEIADGVFTTPAMTDDAEISVTFVHKHTGVEDIGEAEEIHVFGRSQTIHITGAPDNAQATVTDAAGRIVYTGVDREIPIGRSGVYIVTISSRSFKLMI